MDLSLVRDRRRPSRIPGQRYPQLPKPDVVHDAEERRTAVRVAEQRVVGDPDADRRLGRASEGETCASEREEGRRLHSSVHLTSASKARPNPRNGGLDSNRMATKVGINGFGRIGRNFYRAYLEKEPGVRDRRGQRPGRRRRARARAQVRLHARRPRRRRRVLGGRDLGRRQLVRGALGARSNGAPVGGPRRGRRRRVDRPLHRPRGRLAAPDRRREEGRHLGSGDGSRHHDRPRRQRRQVRPRAAQHHLERVVHDELGRPDGEDPAWTTSASKRGS